jgi:hypothetical protein
MAAHRVIGGVVEDGVERDVDVMTNVGMIANVGVVAGTCGGLGVQVEYGIPVG